MKVTLVKGTSDSKAIVIDGTSDSKSNPVIKKSKTVEEAFYERLASFF